MSTIIPFSFSHTPPRAAIFMSGSGTNAEKLLESLAHQRFNTWIPAVIVTDAPLKSRAEEIATHYNVPWVALDIREFYKMHGETRVSLMSERGREIREMWTNALRDMIRPYAIDFIVLAGFVPLTNITADFPTLNIHPGDLTQEENGVRYLAGLHTLPIETAILKGHHALRSSVIIAQAYTGKGGEMDSGPILGISPEVEIDFQGHTLKACKSFHEARPSQRPVGGYKDTFESIAQHNLDRLKIGGDWVAFAPAVADFAGGKFALDTAENLYYSTEKGWEKIKTIVYDGFGNPTLVF